MVDESDGIEEAIDGQTRLLITAAAQAGERLARAREDALRRATARNEREARELQSRFAAEQRSVRAHLEGVQRPEWWDRATPERIAQAYESAVAWRHEEPEAARAEQRISDELRERHGITPDQLRAQVAADRGEQAPARYILTEGHDNAKKPREISRDDALEVIDGMSRAGDLTPTRTQRFDDMRTWIGQDRDVDLAIAAKFPQIMTEDQRTAVHRAEQQAAATKQDKPFELGYTIDENTTGTHQYSKEEALSVLERVSADRAADRSAYLGSDFETWLGKDPDVDRALVEKFGAHMSEERLVAVRQAQADQERADERRDRTEASQVMAEAAFEEDRAQSRPDDPAAAAEHEQHAQDAREEAGNKYDSAERRASMAADLEAQGHDYETVDRQMRADVSQGAPATDATKGSRAPRARKGRARAGSTRQRERGGLSR
ncbi:hypothetical protein Bra3105_18385 (plasmid) [Brachybacterium halotolerans subsp. kimchii]|uniref:hypothetical protein n=1 Tax=Brachybacterium halotolerans TaxID=2795215 RepID=UPI001E3B599B|nr:hypothetical protein [Brachybacterium halotolerans]UEJ84634.1 hypothetical protein Bra3105_18385 [Brachybacterium halotolerans subsp. kimchii]